MNRFYKVFCIQVIAIIAECLIPLNGASATTYISAALSHNDVQLIDSSTSPVDVNLLADFNTGGWSVYRVYLGDGNFSTGYVYNSALIEINQGNVPDDEVIEKATLYLYTQFVVQQYNSDSTLSLLSHLSSLGYTGAADSDYFYIDGPYPIAEGVYRFNPHSSVGWTAIDVTSQISFNAASGIEWAVFWLTPAPWEKDNHIVGEAKGVSIASADYQGGILAPYIEIQTTSTIEKPEMMLLGNGIEIIDGDDTPDINDHTNFGNADVILDEVTRLFTIRNIGSAYLNLTGIPKVSLGGLHAADFTVTKAPVSPVLSGGEATFQITFNPLLIGLRTASLIIYNDDSDENPYEFTIQGYATALIDTDSDGLADNVDPDDDNDSIPDYLDNQPLVKIVNSCSENEIVITGTTYVRGENVLCEAGQSITTQGSVSVSPEAAVIYSAPSVKLGPGFNARAGSMMVVKNPFASEAKVALLSNLSPLAPQIDLTLIDEHAVQVVPAAQRVSRPDYPDALKEIFKAHKNEVMDMFMDATGRFYVFASTGKLSELDSNEVSDIYWYDRQDDRLVFVSVSFTGSASDGLSLHPRMDRTGKVILYQSKATNLVEDDTNGVSDIFLTDIDLQFTERVSHTEDGWESLYAAKHPAIDVYGYQVFYDRYDPKGFRQIYGYILAPRETHIFSVTENEQGERVDSHHPAISPDGRYLVYLETTQRSDASIGSCAINFIDQAMGKFRQLDCPKQLSNDREFSPFFSENGRVITWEEVLEFSEIGATRSWSIRIEVENPFCLSNLNRDAQCYNDSEHLMLLK